MKDSNNPLFYSAGTPPFSKIRPEHIVPAVEYVLSDVERELERLEDRLEKAPSVTWSDVFDTLDELDVRVHRVWSPVSHLFSVKSSDELRKAFEAVQPKLVALGLRGAQSPILYSTFLKLQSDKAQWSSFNNGQKRIIEQRIRSAKNAGVGLKGAEKERFNAISQELAEIRTKFSNNVLDSTKAWSMNLTSKDEVAGLPLHVLGLAAQEWTKRNKGQTPATAELGPWTFTLDAPSYIPFMEFGERRDIRERLYRARMVIASEGAYDNSPLIDRTLKLRAEMSSLLGYDSFAAMSVSSKMAGHVNAVNKLLEDLLSVSYEVGLKEYSDLQSYADSKGFAEKLLEWDVPFWAEKLKQDKYNFSDDELRPYFPMPTVLKGLFELVSKLFSVRVEPADGSADVWDPTVLFFKIFDSNSNKLIAAFYLDPYSRPENKRGGAWMDDCVNRRRVNNHVEIPVAYLVCNGTPPVGGKPSLMSFSDVNTLFHEFGHGLQHMLTEVEEPGVAGIQGVEWDAVELPSQFMENWLYHIPTLKGVSGHVETGEPIPDSYIKKILAARNYRAASQMLRQLQFAMTDINLHHNFDAAKESPHELAVRIAKRTSALPVRPESRTLCSFSHIFSGGYSAGYYSYKWAEVLSADAFAAFEEAGLEKEGDIKRIGSKYRSTVLSLGGSIHPMEVFKQFRGREPDVKALLRHSGLL